jgi:hypothetical protein
VAVIEPKKDFSLGFLSRFSKANCGECSPRSIATKLNKKVCFELISKTDEKFLQVYWKDIFLNLRANEGKAMVVNILANHPNISRYLRAHLIDWLFHAY